MRKTLFLLSIIASFAGCRKQTEGPKEGERYVHVLFPSQAACDQYRQQIGGGVFNCSQTINFRDDNKVSMMVTDIINKGTYTQVGDVIIIEFGGANDAGDFVKLKVIDENTLLEPEYGIEWKRWKGPTAWDVY